MREEDQSHASSIRARALDAHLRDRHLGNGKKYMIDRYLYYRQFFLISWYNYRVHREQPFGQALIQLQLCKGNLLIFGL